MKDFIEILGKDAEELTEGMDAKSISNDAINEIDAVFRTITKRLGKIINKHYKKAEKAEKGGDIKMGQEIDKWVLKMQNDKTLFRDLINGQYK